MSPFPFRALTGCALLLLLATSSLARQSADPSLVAGTLASATSTPGTFVPNVKPTIRLRRSAGAIVVDGRLGDPGWQEAARAENFAEFFPDERALPPIGIEAWMTYDDGHLYVAYRIRDDPAAIRANLSDRDRMFQDDNVGLILDTQGDGQSLIFLGVNPLGIQGDTRITYGNEDVGFNLIFESAGRITDEGYEVEFAIPFRSLRFPKEDEQHWRGTFWVTHPRDSRSQYTWAAVSRDEACWACQFGYIEGIRGVQSGRNLEALPALVGGQSGALRNEDDAALGFDADPFHLEPSVDLKYGITSDLTAELTLNPDFSQIESDVAQIDVNSTFALFFPERRPFFQEGGDLFQTFVQTMYTRSINNPVFAGKMTGRVGRTDVAYLSARDQNTPLLLPFEERSELVEAGWSTSNVARLRHAFPNNSYLGGLFTDRRLDGGGSGSTAGVDGLWRLGGKYVVEAQVVASRTVEPDDASEDLGSDTFDGGSRTVALDGERFGGHALYAGLGREARHWMFRLNYEELSPTFRAGNGFVRQNDARVARAWQGVNVYPRQIRFIDRMMPNVAVWRGWNFDGLRKEDGIEPSIMFQLKGQTHAFLEYRFSRERFAGIDFDGLRMLALGAFSNFSPSVNLGFTASRGLDVYRDADDPRRGRSLTLSGEATLRPTQRVSVSPSVSYATMRDPDTRASFFEGYILRTRTNVQFTRRWMLRAIVQYNDFSERLEIDPLVTYRINPFTVFHVGSTHDLRSVYHSDRTPDTLFRQTERQVFFKFQYLVRA